MGAPLFVRDSAGTRLTKAGDLFLVTSREEIAAAPAPVAKPVVPAGGKATKIADGIRKLAAY